MKRMILIFLIFFLIFTPSTDAELGSWGLIVGNGDEKIIMEKGSKEFLLIRDGLTGLPKTRGLTFFSDNTIVARVGLHTGILTAESYGTANISVTDEAGENGIVQVKVVGIKKLPLPYFLIIIIILILLYRIFIH